MQQVNPSSISHMGQLLLQGYAMLADACPVCSVPLMRKPNSDQIICVNCPAAESEQDQYYNRNSDIIESDTPYQNGMTQQHIRYSNDSVHQQSTPKPSSSDDVAQSLADKMLQGWALLDIHCPRCSTALVQSRNKEEMFCVSCNMYCIDESVSDITIKAAPITDNTTSSATRRYSDGDQQEKMNIRATSANIAHHMQRLSLSLLSPEKISGRNSVPDVLTRDLLNEIIISIEALKSLRQLL